jgi:hypothetical protein
MSPRPRAAEVPAESRDAPAESLHAPAPYWLPVGAEFDGWPPDLQQAALHVINPSYVELVARAAPGVARITGLTIVHLMWLEILDHLKLARMGLDCHLPDPGDPLGVERWTDDLARGRLASTESRERIIERTLRLANAKFKACNVLARLHEFKSQWPRLGPRSFEPPGELPGADADIVPIELPAEPAPPNASEAE